MKKPINKLCKITLALMLVFSSVFILNLEIAQATASIFGNSNFSVQEGVGTTINLQVQVSSDVAPLSFQSSAIEWVFPINHQETQNLPAGTHSMQFMIAPPATGAVGTTTVSTAWMGAAGPINLSFSVNVLQTPTEPAPPPQPTPSIIMDAPLNAIQMQPGVAEFITVTMRNQSTATALNFTLTPVANHNFTIEPVGHATGALQNNATRNFQFRVVPNQNMPSDISQTQIGFTFAFGPANDRTTGTVNVLVNINHPEVLNPSLQIQSTHLGQPSVFAGEQFSIEAIVINTGRAVANNATLNISNFSEIFPIQSVTSAQLGAINPGETAQATFNFTSLERATQFLAQVDFSVSYDLTEGERATSPTQAAFINILGLGEEDETQQQIRVDAITSPMGVFSPDSIAHFSVAITNIGDETIRNIRIASTPDANIVPRMPSIQTILQLLPNESATVDFAFSATDLATSRFYNIGFGISYNDNSFEIFSGFNVFNPDEDDEDDQDLPESVPRLIISNYVVEPLIVMAGNEFDVFMTIQNTHSIRHIQNALVTGQVVGTAGGGGQAGVQGGTFTPVGQSNIFFIDHIPPSVEYSQPLRMFAIPNAAPGHHVITVTFIFEDDLGREHTQIEQIGINVQQISELTVGAIDISDFLMVGNAEWLNFTVHNTGLTTLANVRVSISGENISGHEEIFGTLQIGEHRNFWGSFTPTAGGPTTLQILVAYVDSVGITQEIVHNFDIDVIGGGDMGDMGDIGGGGDIFFPPGGGDFEFWPGMEGDEDGWFIGFIQNPWVWASASAVVLAIGGIIFVVLRKKKQNKLFDDFDDDDDKN